MRAIQDRARATEEMEVLMKTAQAEEGKNVPCVRPVSLILVRETEEFDMGLGDESATNE